MTEIILASVSPRRRQLLKEIGLKFTIIPSRVKEKIYHHLSPAQIVKKLALLKASDVAQRVKSGIIIGADTIVVRRGEILGKPRNPQHAREILDKLSGTIHYVYTGVAVIDKKSGKKIVDYEKTKVKMKKLTPEEIEYHSHRHLDKAGAYAVQEEKDAFIQDLEGCYYNVVGLPTNKLKRMLNKLKAKS